MQITQVQNRALDVPLLQVLHEYEARAADGRDGRSLVDGSLCRSSAEGEGLRSSLEGMGRMIRGR